MVVLKDVDGMRRVLEGEARDGDGRRRRRRVRDWRTMGRSRWMDFILVQSSLGKTVFVKARGRGQGLVEPGLGFFFVGRRPF